MNTGVIKLTINIAGIGTCESLTSEPAQSHTLTRFTSPFPGKREWTGLECAAGDVPQLKGAVFCCLTCRKLCTAVQLYVSPGANGHCGKCVAQKQELQAKLVE